MTTQLVDLTASLQRAVAPPGQFETFYPDSGDDDQIGHLADGFSQAQLDGFFAGWNLDLDAFTTDQDLEPPAQALVVIYAASQMLRTKLMSMTTHVKYVAGSVSFEQDSPAGILTRLLDQNDTRVKDLRKEAKQAGAGAAFYMADRYLAFDVTNYGGF